MRLSVLLALLAVASFLLWAGCSAPAKAAVHEGVAADGTPYRGAQEARLVIVEYGDFQCPNCRLAQPAIEEFLSEYQARGVRMVFKHFPLENIHSDARNASIAAVCAQRQGKFWAYHDLLYARQERLDAASLRSYAQELGLDMGAFSSCQTDASAARQVDADTADALSSGISATPSFRVGDLTLVGGQSKERMAAAADRALSR